MPCCVPDACSGQFQSAIASTLAVQTACAAVQSFSAVLHRAAMGFGRRMPQRYGCGRRLCPYSSIAGRNRAGVNTGCRHPDSGPGSGAIRQRDWGQRSRISRLWECRAVGLGQPNSRTTSLREVRLRDCRAWDTPTAGPGNRKGAVPVQCGPSRRSGYGTLPVRVRRVLAPDRPIRETLFVPRAGQAGARVSGTTRMAAGRAAPCACFPRCGWPCFSRCSRAYSSRNVLPIRSRNAARGLCPSYSILCTAFVRGASTPSFSAMS